MNHFFPLIFSQWICFILQHLYIIYYLLILPAFLSNDFNHLDSCSFIIPLFWPWSCLLLSWSLSRTSIVHLDILTQSLSLFFHCSYLVSGIWSSSVSASDLLAFWLPDFPVILVPSLWSYIILCSDKTARPHGGRNLLPSGPIACYHCEHLWEKTIFFKIQPCVHIGSSFQEETKVALGTTGNSGKTSVLSEIPRTTFVTSCKEFLISIQHLLYFSQHIFPSTYPSC